MKLLRHLTVSLALGVAPAALLAQDTWSWLSPTPSGNRLARYAYGQGRFVGVGDSGMILTSTDGANWTPRESGTNEPLTHVAFDGSRFVAASSGGLLASADGLSWTRQDARATVYDLTAGNGLFVAIVGGTTPTAPHRFLTSSDGTTWTVRETSSNPQRVLFANGVFVAPDTSGHVLVSADSVNWADATVSANAQASWFFAAGNNRFLLYDGIASYLSTDGRHWRDVTTRRAMPGGYTSAFPTLGYQSTLGFAGGYFYLQESRHAPDAYAQYRSADGENWTAISTLSNFDFGTLASGGGVSVASEVPWLYALANPSAYAIHSSTDGLAWTTRSSAVVSSLRYPHLVYGLGRFFFAGKLSNDLVRWVDGGFSPTHAAGERLFRIESRSSSGDVTPEIIANDYYSTSVDVSADGLTSTTVNVQMRTPRAVAYGAGRYVIVGHEGKIATSPDAATWTAVTSGSTRDLLAVIYAFDRFVAVGRAGTLLTSPDGRTWTDESSTPAASYDLGGLAAGPDRIVALATPVMTPPPLPSGPTMIAGSVPVYLTSAHAFQTVTCFNGTFLAVAIVRSVYSYFDQPSLWKSTDGAAWTQLPLHLSSGYTPLPQFASGNGAAVLHLNVGTPASTTVYDALLQTGTASGTFAPTIVAPPVSQTTARGESVAFSVGATGSGAFAYQWSHGGSPVAGATSAVLRLDLITDASAGAYAVTVTNSAGSATSAAATLAVVAPTPLTIATEPQGGAVYEYRPLVLSVRASGSGPIAYQWRRNGQPVSGATSPTYSVYGNPYFISDQIGNYDVVVTAPYSTVTSRAVPVVWGGATATFSLGGGVTRQVGESVTISATVTGNAPFTYRWFRSGANGSIAGATGATLMLENLMPSDSSSISLEVTDASGHTSSFSAINLVVSSDLGLGNQPSSTALAEGRTFSLGSGYYTAPGASYQWYHNGVAIPGATRSALVFQNFTFADAGDYSVVRTLYAGATPETSATTTLTLDYARLVNLSARGVAGTGEDTLIAGFVLSGAPDADVLVRSIGPELTRLGVTNVLPDPSLRVVKTAGTLVAENDNWSTPILTGLGTAATTAAMNGLGAFPLTANGHDSAVNLHLVPSGLYSTLVSGPSGTTGVVLNEVYGPTASPQRLVNLSARARVGDGDALLIGGFVIAGTHPLRVLIRGVGPGLAAQGVRTALANPKVTLYRGGDAIHNNDNWGQAANLADLRTATSAVGAFALPEGSNDAAMLETLEPGAYSVHVTSVDGSPGVALVELYAAP